MLTRQLKQGYRPKTTPYMSRKYLLSADHKQKTINRLHRPKRYDVFIVLSFVCISVVNITTVVLNFLRDLLVT